MKKTKRKSSNSEGPSSKVNKPEAPAVAKEQPKKAKPTKTVVEGASKAKQAKQNFGKEKIHQLKAKVQKGDEAARKELEGLIKKLEAQNKSSRRSRRKLNMYRNILKPKTQ